LLLRRFCGYVLGIGDDASFAFSLSMSTPLLPVPFVLALIASPLLWGATPWEAEARAALEQLRARHGLPALAAAAAKDGEVVFLSATGVRSQGQPEPVAPTDLWHVGSCTKSMTATLVGVLVEERKISWETTVHDALPELREHLDEHWKPVTIEQLLTNRGGAPGEPPGDVWQRAWQQRGTELSQRLDFTRALVRRAPAYPPGSRTEYSNQGYAIAGAMIERLSGKPFDALLREKVFEPLGIRSAGFGAPGIKGAQDQPRGHRARDDGWQAVEPGPKADNPAAITPAGRVHLSMADFLRYTSWHARGPLRDVKLMSEENFQRLHRAPEGSDYAMGWIVTERKWAGGRSVTMARTPCGTP
jgi:CubicO group peptidase (beta-lactamase class C family)